MVVVVASIFAVPNAWSATKVTPISETIQRAPSTPASLVPFLPNIRITDGSSPYAWQVEPTMVVNKSGTVFVGWKETDSPTAAGIRVGSSYSTDQGRSWAKNILMNQTHPNKSCRDSDPWMAVDPNDLVHFAYLEYDPSGGSSPPCNSGLDVSNTTNGHDWGNVHYIGGNGGLVDKDSIVFDSQGRLYATWDEGNNLAFTWSDDHGNHWAPVINPGGQSSVLGTIVNVASNGTVYLTWWNFAQSNILFESSSDRGKTWSTIVRVNDRDGSASGGFPQYPLPAMNTDPKSGAIYVSWADSRNGNPDIYFTNSTDGGKTWGTNHRINDNSGTSQQYMVDLAIDRHGTVHAAWEDARTGNWNIFYSNSTNGGATWATNLRVTSEETPYSYTRPGDYFAIEAGPDDAINVVWTDGRGQDFDIYFARSTGFPTATITVTTSPVGLPVTVDGVTGKSPVAKTWPIGSSHNLSTTSPIPLTPTSRYNWTSWSDGGAISHSITADNDRTITASFTKQFQSSVAPDPEGLSVMVDGVAYTAKASFWWNDGSSHSLQAPTPQSVSPDVRWVWSSWSDGGLATHTVTANAALVLNATFVQEQAMHVSTSPVALTFSVDNVPYSTAHTFWFEPGSYHTVSVSTLQMVGSDTRYQFQSWSDGGAATHVFVFNAAMSIQATFSTEYKLTWTSPVPGAAGAAWYPAGASAVATVTDQIYAVAPGQRLSFQGWSGDATGTGLTSDPIVMNGPKTAVASYGTQFYLAVESPYLTTTGSGWYADGSSATATVSGTELDRGTDTRVVFLSWSGGASGTGATSNPIVMNGAKIATAQWKTQYVLTIQAAPGIATTAGWYDAGTSAVARLESGVIQRVTGIRTVFVGWVGDATGSDSGGSSPILMNGPRSVAASWRTEYELRIATSYGQAVGAGWYQSGSFAVAAVNASTIGTAPGTRVVFAGWATDAAGASASGSNPIAMNGPKVAAARWNTEYYLQVDSDVGTIGGSGWYASGTSVDLTAPAQTTSAGQTYAFSGWTGAVTSTGTSTSVTMDGPKVVKANWTTTGTLGGISGTTSGLIVLVVAIAVVAAILALRRRGRRE
jgi:hypothetical protein